MSQVNTHKDGEEAPVLLLPVRVASYLHLVIVNKKLGFAPSGLIPTNRNCHCETRVVVTGRGNPFIRYFDSYRIFNLGGCYAGLNTTTSR